MKIKRTESAVKVSLKKPVMPAKAGMTPRIPLQNFLKLAAKGAGLWFLAAVLSSAPALAGEAVKVTVTVSKAWARATVPGQQVAGAYLQISSSENAALVSAKSPVAKNVEIHVMSMEAGMMSMRQIDRLELPAGKTVALAPGGYHLMLTGLKQPLKKGDVVPLHLTIQGKNKSRSVVKVNAEVREIGVADADTTHSHP